MENKKLFRILSLIPEDLVESYCVEFINRKGAGEADSPTQLRPTISGEISSLYDLFITYFDTYIDLISCKVLLKEGGFIEIDCLGGLMRVNAAIQFAFIDKLVSLGLLGADKPLNTVRFL